MQALTFDTTLDRQLLPTTGGQRYLRIVVRAPRSAAPVERMPLNLAFVLDRSGSMTGTKLRLVKEAVTFGLSQLTASDRAALVVYDDEVTVIDEGTLMTDVAKRRFTAELSRVDTGGGTALGDGWLAGCRMVARDAAGSGRHFLNRALLLSDGLANVGIADPVVLAAHAMELCQRGVTTSTFGVGADFDERLMSGIADAGGGAFYYIEHPRQIPDFFMGELGELLSVVAERVTLRLVLPRRMQAELLNDFPCEGGAGVFTIVSGALSAGEERTFLVALHGAAGELDEELPVEITLRYHDTTSDSDRELSVRTTVRYATPETVEAAPLDGTILELAGQLEAARAKRAALEEIYAGRFDEARQQLSSAMDVLAAPAMAPASATLHETMAELDELARVAEGGWDSATRKQALYSSQVVSKSRRDYGKQR